MRIGSYAFQARLSKRSVAVISIEPICAEVRHINIGIPVVIVIAAGGTVAVTAFVADTGYRCDIGETSIAVISVEDTGCCAIYQVDIKLAIVVIIEECAACAEGFGEVILSLCAVIVRETDAGGFGDIGEVDARFRGKRTQQHQEEEEECLAAFAFHFRSAAA